MYIKIQDRLVNFNFKLIVYIISTYVRYLDGEKKKDYLPYMFRKHPF